MDRYSNDSNDRDAMYRCDSIDFNLLAHQWKLAAFTQEIREIQSTGLNSWKSQYLEKTKQTDCRKKTVQDSIIYENCNCTTVTNKKTSTFEESSECSDSCLTSNSFKQRNVNAHDTNHIQTLYTDSSKRALRTKSNDLTKNCKNMDAKTHNQSEIIGYTCMKENAPNRSFKNNLKNIIVDAEHAISRRRIVAEVFEDFENLSLNFSKQTILRTGSHKLTRSSVDITDSRFANTPVNKRRFTKNSEFGFTKNDSKPQLSVSDVVSISVTFDKNQNTKTFSKTGNHNTVTSWESTGTDSENNPSDKNDIRKTDNRYEFRNKMSDVSPDPDYKLEYFDDKKDNEIKACRYNYMTKNKQQFNTKFTASKPKELNEVYLEYHPIPETLVNCLNQTYYETDTFSASTADNSSSILLTVPTMAGICSEDSRTNSFITALKSNIVQSFDQNTESNSFTETPCFSNTIPTTVEESSDAMNEQDQRSNSENKYSIDNYDVLTQIQRTFQELSIRTQSGLSPTGKKITTPKYNKMLIDTSRVKLFDIADKRDRDYTTPRIPIENSLMVNPSDTDVEQYKNGEVSGVFQLSVVLLPHPINKKFLSASPIKYYFEYARPFSQFNRSTTPGNKHSV